MKRIFLVVCALVLASLACVSGSSSYGVGTVRTLTNGDTAAAVRPQTSEKVCAVVLAEVAENLRGEAGADQRIIGHLVHGQVVQVLDQADSMWWRVSDQDFVGYARSRYLEVVPCAIP